MGAGDDESEIKLFVEQYDVRRKSELILCFDSRRRNCQKVLPIQRERELLVVILRKVRRFELLQIAKYLMQIRNLNVAQKFMSEEDLINIVFGRCNPAE